MSLLPRLVSSVEEDSDDQDDANAQLSSPNKIHWIISWDINETILVGDEVGGDSREDCFNKMIAKSAFVRIPTSSDNHRDSSVYDYDNTSALKPTHWWDDTSFDDTSSIPPLYTGWEWPNGCCPYYRTSYKKISKTFVEHHGKVYKPLYQEIERRLTTIQQDQSVFKNILPAFFRTIYQLVHNNNQEGPPITFVFRTFGVDLPHIAQAMTAFARGQHPEYPDFVHPEYELDLGRLYNAKWVNKGEYFQYQLYGYDNHQEVVAAGDQQVLKLLHDTTSGHYVYGIRDDYEMWKSHGWEPWAGKPVWKTEDSHHHHILLDDNIHNLPKDGIASVRRAVPFQHEEQQEKIFESLSGEEIQAQHGLHLIRVPTIEPILNPDWLLKQIYKAQRAAIKDRTKS